MHIYHFSDIDKLTQKKNKKNSGRYNSSVTIRGGIIRRGEMYVGVQQVRIK